MKYMLIAGEASGDLHASHLITALAKDDPKAEFVIIGGDLMGAAAGVQPRLHISRMNFMGFAQVIANMPAVVANLKLAKQLLHDERPDKLILVDYPSFNLRVAKEAHALGIPVYYYISPKLWAWKAWRIKSIKRLVAKVLCILPFEPKWYAERGYSEAVYVGNPSVGEIDAAIASAPSREDFLRANRLRDHRIIALLPGSRKGEIKGNLPIMDAVARQFPQYTIVVAGAPAIPDDFYKGLTKFTVIRDQTHWLLAHTHAALVTSGTATLEAALAGVPQVALYRSNGSKMAYKIMEKILHVKFVTLPNLICDSPVIPEMLMHHCNVEEVTAELRRLTPACSEARELMLKGYARMRGILTNADAPTNAAHEIRQ